MPEKSKDNVSNLVSHGVEEALSGKQVKSMLIPETKEILLPNYVIDFRAVEKVRKHQIQALNSFLVDDGDTAIYICLKAKDESVILEKIGMGDSNRLDRIILVGIKSVFGDHCRVYQNVEHGKALRELKQNDPNKTRLRL